MGGSGFDMMIPFKVSLFLVVFTGILIYMPSEITTGVDPIDYNVQNTWDPWVLFSNMTYLEHSISQGSKVAYSFSSVSADYQLIVQWDTWWGVEAVRVRKSVNFLVPEWYEPDGLTLLKLQGAWDPSINASMVKLTNSQGTVVAYFEDTNSTRNNITSAFNANLMNCTLAFGRDSVDQDLWSSKDIVFSLLSFRLPSVFDSVDPMFGFIMSAIFYVPVAYIVFFLLLKIVRGV